MLCSLYGVVTPRPDVPDKTMPDEARRSQTKKWLVLSGFLHQKFAGNLKQVGQIVPDNTRFCLFVNKGKFWCCLAQSGPLPSSFLQTSVPGSQIEPAIFWSCSVWDNFVWDWCNYTISPIFFGRMVFDFG